MFCTNCGRELPDKAQFCSGCGTRQTASVTPVTPTAPVYAAPIPALAPKKKKSGVKITLLILIPVLLIASGVAAWLGISAANKKAYEEAEKLAEEGRYEEALEAFEELGAFSDSADRAEEMAVLAEQSADYEAAMDLMLEGKYDKAIKAFEKLDDYADSEEMAESGVRYQQGLDMLAGASQADDYKDAIAIFEAIIDYKESANQLSHAYLGLALMAVEGNDISTAMELTDYLNEEDKQKLSDALMDIVMDARALIALEESLMARQARIEEDPYVTYGELCELELGYMAEFEGGLFADGNIQELIQDYLDGLLVQANSLYDDGSYPEYMVAWYTGTAMRCEAVDALIDGYQFLSDNDELRETYEDSHKLSWAMVEIETVLESQLWGIAPTQDDDGYYLSLYNDSGYDFTMDVLQRYGYNGSFVGDENQFTMDVPSGKTVKVYLLFPDDLEYTEWYIDWVVYDVYDGNEKLD